LIYLYITDVLSSLMHHRISACVVKVPCTYDLKKHQTCVAQSYFLLCLSLCLCFYY